MIDLHNHILPGIDDGARNMAEALAMARMAVEQGVTVMAATPHRFYAGKENRSDYILRKTADLQSELSSDNVLLSIVPGIELTMNPDIPKGLRDGDLLPIGGPGGTHVLIEPPFDRVPRIALELLESVLEMGLTPILAHPERNGEIQRSPAFLETCAALGIVIQVTAGSIMGRFGMRAQESARQIVSQEDWKVIIASDAHDMLDRTPSDMTTAVLTVASWIGDEQAAKRMAEDLPASLIPSVP